jgi:hypothetical protein
VSGDVTEVLARPEWEQRNELVPGRCQEVLIVARVSNVRSSDMMSNCREQRQQAEVLDETNGGPDCYW